MKFLEVDSLDLINTDFRWETSECILTGRVEAYSCKYIEKNKEKGKKKKVDTNSFFFKASQQELTRSCTRL